MSPKSSLFAGFFSTGFGFDSTSGFFGAGVVDLLFEESLPAFIIAEQVVIEDVVVHAN